MMQALHATLHARLDALYAEFKRGQLGFVFNAFDDDVEFVSYSPTGIFPFLGHHRGKAAVMEALQDAHKEFEFISYQPTSKVIEADAAAIQLFSRAVSRRTGRSVQLSVAHFLRFRGDKIIEIREFMDSFSAAEQLLGRPLDVSEDIYLV
jgi:uncharacterized protein